MKPKRRYPRQQKGLQELINYLRLRKAVGVEVGSYAGESAEMFVKSGKFAQLTCVDSWQGIFADAEPHFDSRMAEYDEVAKLKLSSLEAAAHFEDNSLDFIYIDGDHSYEACSADIKAWRPKLKSGGYMCGHDYFHRFPGVVQAVFEELGKPHRVFRDSSWVVRVR